MPPGRRSFDPGKLPAPMAPSGSPAVRRRGFRMPGEAGSALRSAGACAGPALPGTLLLATVHLRHHDRYPMLRLMPVPASSYRSPPSGGTDDGR